MHDLISPFEPQTLIHEILMGFQDFAIENGISIYYDPGCGGLAPWPRSWYVVACEDCLRLYHMDDITDFPYEDPQQFEKLVKFLRKLDDRSTPTSTP